MDSSIQLWGIDNLSRAGSEWNRTPLKHLGVRFIHGDLRSASDLDSLPTVDWVIDCAAMPSVLAGTEGNGSPRQLIEHNVLSSVNLLEYCRARRSGLILLSTSRVYSIEPLSRLPLIVRDNALVLDLSCELAVGVSSSGIDESFSTVAPVSLYGATKLASETMACEYAWAFDIPLRINRCGVLAGAGQFGRAEQGIFSFWIHSHHARKSLKYIGANGTGFQVRDCLHPMDVARLVLLQMHEGLNPKKPVIANVSGGIESARSLYQLTQWCNEEFGDHEVHSSDEVRPFDLPWIVLNSELARQMWNWTPALSTDQILSEIAEHARTHTDWLEYSQ